MSADHPTTSAPVEYRDVPGFPNYRIGSDMSVWSHRLVRRESGCAREWVRKSAHVANNGYYCVNLYRDGKQYNKLIHLIMLEAFVGPRPPGMQCCHNNGNRLDNRPENLRWDTPSANNLDIVRHGKNPYLNGKIVLRVPLGELHPFAKLKNGDIPVIRQLKRSGVNMAEIGRRFLVSRRTISDICSGKTWSHV